MPTQQIVIVGASIAGCTAAILCARRGLKVTLLERHSRAESYKKLCTHFIQASALPTIQRLGLAERIEAAGGVRNTADVWTPWGWLPQPEPEPGSKFPAYGYNIRRSTLDPMLRQLAAETPGVDLRMGYTANRLLLDDDDRVCSVEATDAQGRPAIFHADLIVAADGRHSSVAAMAGVPVRHKHNSRFCCFAHYRGLPESASGRARLWTALPDGAAIFPNEDGIAVVGCMADARHLTKFQRDTETAYHAYLEKLPDPPDLRQAERVSPLLLMPDMTNLQRQPVHRGMALIGDAALASDPLFGIGCGWAFTSAEWLVESTANALLGREKLPHALRRYRQRHRRELMLHEAMIANFSAGRPLNLLEALLIRAAVDDLAIARQLTLFGQRSIGVLRLLFSLTLLRAAWINLRQWLSGSRRWSAPPDPAAT